MVSTFANLVTALSVPPSQALRFFLIAESASRPRGRVDGHPAVGKMAVDEGEVLFVSFCEGSGQTSRGFRIKGEENHARGFAVEAVHRKDLAAVTVFEEKDEGVVEIPSPGVHGQIARFVDGNEPFVLVENSDFPVDPRLHDPLPVVREELSAFQHRRGIEDRLAVQGHPPGEDLLPPPLPREIGEPVGAVAIEIDRPFQDRNARRDDPRPGHRGRPGAFLRKTGDMSRRASRINARSSSGMPMASVSS